MKGSMSTVLEELTGGKKTELAAGDRGVSLHRDPSGMRRLWNNPGPLRSSLTIPFLVLPWNLLPPLPPCMRTLLQPLLFLLRVLLVCRSVLSLTSCFLTHTVPIVSQDECPKAQTHMGGRLHNSHGSRTCTRGFISLQPPRPSPPPCPPARGMALPPTGKQESFQTLLTRPSTPVTTDRPDRSRPYVFLFVARLCLSPALMASHSDPSLPFL